MSKSYKTYSKSSRPSSKGGKPQKTESAEIKAFKEKMNKYKFWADYPVADFAGENADAYKIANAFTKTRSSGQNKSSQLRKFYDAAVRVKSKIYRNDKKSRESARSELLMLVPRVFYSHARGLITDDVKDFFSAALKKEKFRIENGKECKQDYDRFMQFFEAVIGYHRFLKPD